MPPVGMNLLVGEYRKELSSKWARFDLFCCWFYCDSAWVSRRTCSDSCRGIGPRSLGFSLFRETERIRLNVPAAPFRRSTRLTSTP